jgi:hypothetical protein
VSTVTAFLLVVPTTTHNFGGCANHDIHFCWLCQSRHTILMVVPTTTHFCWLCQPFFTILLVVSTVMCLGFGKPICSLVGFGEPTSAMVGIGEPTCTWWASGNQPLSYVGCANHGTHFCWLCQPSYTPTFYNKQYVTSVRDETKQSRATIMRNRNCSTKGVEQHNERNINTDKK